jgi:hypothetical protein
MIMKIAWRRMLLAAPLVLIGCADPPDQSRGDKPGGRGAPDKQTVHGRADETFNLGPERIYLRQGERRSVAVAIFRSTNFNEDVTLGFGELPKGLSVDNGSPVIKRDNNEAHFALTATDDASVGEFSIRITGHPTKGVDASNDFHITVDKK